MPSWILTIPAVPTPVATPGTRQAAAAQTGQTQAGILRPFRRDQKQDFAWGEGSELVRSALGQALGTRKGELPWDGDFGSLLHTLRHKNLTDSDLDLARVYVRDTMRQIGCMSRAVRVTQEIGESRMNIAVDDCVYTPAQRLA